MCSTDASSALLSLFVFVPILGSPAVASFFAWRARGKRASFATAALCAALGLLLILVHPSANAPVLPGVMGFVDHLLVDVLPWILLAAGLAWVLVAAVGLPLRLVGLALATAGLAIVLAWAFLQMFGPNVCDLLMPPRAA